MTNMSIQPLWLTYFIEILLVLEFQLTKTYFGTFSYKAHLDPKFPLMLKHKSEVFDLFKVFRPLVENQYGRKLKILRYNNGGEYVKSKFIQYSKYAGI